jgi:hypothetical protein
VLTIAYSLWSPQSTVRRLGASIQTQFRVRPAPKAAQKGGHSVGRQIEGTPVMTAQKYAGSCQCGAVAYEVSLDLANTITCNCSRCRRLGVVLAFAPWDQFTLTKGEDATTTYKFNTHAIEHRFCKTCGIQSYARGTGPDLKVMAAINVRCLDGVDLDALAPTAVDGAKY